ncbi:hypothetical protein D3C75_1231150 [compost metagenome]
MLTEATSHGNLAISKIEKKCSGFIVVSAAAYINISLGSPGMTNIINKNIENFLLSSNPFIH